MQLCRGLRPDRCVQQPCENSSSLRLWSLRGPGFTKSDGNMNPQINAIDFNERPFIAIWEVTQACDLACVHCRASAQPDRDPMELSTAEGKNLIDQIAALKVPVFVLTGGDPIKRPDLFELIGHARSVGVSLSASWESTPDPSSTEPLTRSVGHRVV
jgi:MoaA/NifB/PqqE/SkfB family radical SAM enzyme